jgi:hypothetical protein
LATPREKDRNLHKAECSHVAQPSINFTQKISRIKTMKHYGTKEWKREYMRTYREANKEKLTERERAYAKAYQEANKDKVKAYREANKEKIAKRSKAYQEANKEKIKEYQKAYREAKKRLTSSKKSAELKP